MKTREINRYHVYKALLVALLCTVLLVFRAQKQCGYSQGRFGHYCGLDETWAWLKAGGDVWFWSFLAIITVAGLSALRDLGKD